MAIQIRAWDPAVDEPLLLQLWAGAFGSQWPMEPDWLRAVSLTSTFLVGDHLIAEVDGCPGGFILTQVGNGIAPGGSILALGVLPGFRRQGLGTSLYQAALQRLCERRAGRVQLGAGALEYFWPGVPLDLAGAWPFFLAMGWKDSEHSFDLVRGLDGAILPAWVGERVSGLGIDFITAESLPVEPVLALVAAEQGGWSDVYARFLQHHSSRDVLLARRRADGKLVGACLLEENSLRWARRFACPLGAPACILTAEVERGKGIGLALVARAGEILQARGCRTSFIGWTWLVDWYGKLGYTVWQEYVMSSRVLPNNA